MRQVYWDACTWISLMMQEAGRAPSCEEIISLASRGEVEIWTSTLNLAECFKKKCSGDDVGIQKGKDVAFEHFLRQGFVKLIPVDWDVARISRDLLRNFTKEGLRKPNDAIHLASAVLNNIHEFHTFDNKDLLPLNGKISALDNKPIKITEPPPPQRPGLFSNVPNATTQNLDNNNAEEEIDNGTSLEGERNDERPTSEPGDTVREGDKNAPEHHPSEEKEEGQPPTVG